MKYRARAGVGGRGGRGCAAAAVPKQIYNCGGDYPAHCLYVVPFDIDCEETSFANFSAPHCDLVRASARAHVYAHELLLTMTVVVVVVVVVVVHNNLSSFT